MKKIVVIGGYHDPFIGELRKVIAEVQGYTDTEIVEYRQPAAAMEFIQNVAPYEIYVIISGVLDAAAVIEETKRRKLPLVIYTLDGQYCRSHAGERDHADSLLPIFCKRHHDGAESKTERDMVIYILAHFVLGEQSV